MAPPRRKKADRKRANPARAGRASDGGDPRTMECWWLSCLGAREWRNWSDAMVSNTIARKGMWVRIPPPAAPPAAAGPKSYDLVRRVYHSATSAAVRRIYGWLGGSS